MRAIDLLIDVADAGLGLVGRFDFRRSDAVNHTKWTSVLLLANEDDTNKHNSCYMKTNCGASSSASGNAMQNVESRGREKNWTDVV
jgi:hypothetical protein